MENAQKEGPIRKYDWHHSRCLVKVLEFSNFKIALSHSPACISVRSISESIVVLCIQGNCGLIDARRMHVSNKAEQTIEIKCEKNQCILTTDNGSYAGLLETVELSRNLELNGIQQKFGTQQVL